MKHYILVGTFILLSKMVRPDFVDEFRNNLASQIQQQVQSAIRGIPMVHSQFQQSFGPMSYPAGQRMGENDGGAEDAGRFSSRIGSFSHVDPSNVCEQNVGIGSFSNIGPQNRFESNTRIGNYVRMGASNEVQPYCRFGNYVSIGDRNSIGYNTNFENYANTGHDNNIGAYCDILSYASIQNHVKIGNGAKLCSYSTVFNNANIGNGSLLDRYSTLKSGAKLEPKVYLGKYSSVDAYVPNSVVIQEYVNVPSGTSIEPGEVIMRSPSSLQLYQQCASLKDIPSNYLSNVDVSLKQLIDELINDFKVNCGQRTFDKLAILKSLYLIKFHGVDNFRQYEQEVKFPNVLNTGPTCSPTAVLYQKLENETHFGPNATIKDILSPDQTREMMQILAIDEDSKRQERVADDEFCTMIGGILNGQRKVTCAKRNLSVFCTGNQNSF